MESYKSFLKDFEYKKGTLTVVTGLPGVGKSYFIENEVFNLIKNGVKVLYENCDTPNYDVVMELFSIYYNKDIPSINYEEEIESIRNSPDTFFRNISFSSYPRDKVYEFIKDIDKNVSEHNLDVIVMDVSFTNDSDETIRLLREKAKELNVAIILTVYQPVISRPHRDHIYTKMVWDNFIDIKCTEDVLERKLLLSIE